MNDMNSTGTCRWPARHALVLLILLGLLVLTQLIRAWLSWQHETGSFRQVRAVAGHELVAVTLTSGQVYYGNLEAAGNEYLRIGGIYYVQREDAQNGSPPQFHLINRKKSDWHAPDWMAIPRDKILYVEDVGNDSRMAGLIRQEQNSGQAH